MRYGSIGKWAVTCGAIVVCGLEAAWLNGQSPSTNPAPGLTPAPARTPVSALSPAPVTAGAPAADPASMRLPTTRPAIGGDAAKPGRPTSRPADAKQLGGEPESIVQVANLIYAGTKSSKCFSDHFLVTAEKESAISTSRRFHAVKLDSEELFAFPLVIMTGEGDFCLTAKERENLQAFINRGGFLLASAGCSSKEWPALRTWCA